MIVTIRWILKTQRHVGHLIRRGPQPSNKPKVIYIGFVPHVSSLQIHLDKENLDAKMKRLENLRKKMKQVEAEVLGAKKQG